MRAIPLGGHPREDSTPPSAPVRRPKTMRVLKSVPLGPLLAGSLLPGASTQTAPEAPVAFDANMQLVSNGFTSPDQFAADQASFEEREQRADGLGPVY